MLGCLQFDDRAARESSSPEVDELIDRATEAATKFTGRLIDELAAIVQTGEPTSHAQEQRIFNFLVEQETLLAPVFQRVLLASSLAGSADIIDRVRRPGPFDPTKLATGRSRLPPNPPRIATLMPDDDLPKRFKLKLPILERVEKTLAEQPALAGSDFIDTATKARAGAFTMTGNLRQATIEKVRDIFAENLRKGSGRKEFVRDVREQLADDAEGSPLSEGRLRQIFRTNVAQYFQSGQDKALESPLVVDGFPYRLQLVTEDERVRATHLAIATAGIDGTAVFHKDDPVWRTLGGAWDYNCRCAGAPLTVDGAAGKGVREAIEWLARAEDLRAKHGGYRGQYYAETAPAEFTRVNWPTYDGKPIMPSPGFRKDATAN